MTLHSTLSPFEKRAMDREFRQLGISTSMANACTKVASRHLDVAMEVRRLEWARAVTHLSFLNHQNQDQQPQAQQEVEG